MTLSARAFGILCYLVQTGCPTSAKHLQTVFKEGRDAIRVALKELHSLGLLERRNTLIGSNFCQETVLTDEAYALFSDAGFQAPAMRVFRPLFQPSEQNNHIPNNLISKEYTREAREEYVTMYIGEEMPYEFFDKTSSDDDMIKQRQKAMQYKKDQYQAAKRERNAKQIVKRDSIDQELWTSSDVGYEFSDRLMDKWNIKPWSVTKSRFIPALAEMRKRLDTNGRIEIIMMDLFFEAIDFQKYDDGEVLWKMFIKRAPELVAKAKHMVATPEQLEIAQVAADKSWDWMEE